ncbi:ankyrin repeat domain-containing protein 36A-like isoform X2 [Dendronephthya gigantea]|uniref:ankyrin repeat domain-containing protein 36A-like isoform X2 n=1 Tax=Dendronephthya gigantea TaxID=151771 RepID=UPI00106AB922|nr:ankyrin repeat domain-containing protein 36A-like isoform X2 [Dendronephthya gigantea]
MAGLKKFLKKHGGKKGSASKEDVRSNADNELAFGYVIAKEKDLPKLHKAVWGRDTTKVKQLCKKADINQFDKENRTPLHLAAATGNDEITRFLLANKAKTNLCDNDGRTALMKAIECSHNGCIELLLDNNADVKVTDINASSTLHLAAANNLIDTATLLLRKGMNINISDKEGFTPLHVAASLGNQDFVLYLLNEHANVDCVDAHGRTPLMTAAADGHMDIVKMLLQNDADVSLKDAQGWKASDHAVMNGIHSCAKIIDDHELRQTQEKEKAKALEKKEPAKIEKKPDIMEVLKSASPVNEDLDFTFGGPAADKVGNDAFRSEDSTSRQSEEEDSWGEDTDEDISEPNKKSTKVSLAAALKKVERSESNESGQSRIPVRSSAASPSTTPARSPEKVTYQPPSKIPRPVSSSPPTSGGLPSPEKSSSPRELSSTNKQHPISPTTSAKSATSGKSTPAVTSPQPRSRVVSPSESVRSGSNMQGRLDRRVSGGSLPLEYLKPSEENTDSEQGAKKKADQSLGYSPSFLSPRSDQSNRNLADELGLSLSGSEIEEDSVMSGEVSFDDASNRDEPKVLTSTVKPQGERIQGTKNPAEYLGLDLDSPVSSVSDPDISGMSDNKRNRERSKNEKTPENKVSKSDSRQRKDTEETDSNWDSSEVSLPSENEKETEQTSKPSVKSKHDSELKAAVEKRKTTLEKSTLAEGSGKERSVDKNRGLTDDKTGVLTGSESTKEETRKKELEKMKEQGMAKLKAEENKKMEIEKKLQEEKEKEKSRMKNWEREQQEKEEQRQKDWEREQQEKEQELAKSIKKELEDELGIESDFNVSDEGSEVQSGSQVDDDEGSLLYSNEQRGTEDVTTGYNDGKNENVMKGSIDQRLVSNEQPTITGDVGGRDNKNSGKDISSAPTDVIPVQQGTSGDADRRASILGDFEDQESSQWDSSHDDDLENDQDGVGGEGSFEDKNSRRRKDTEGSELSFTDNDSRNRRDTGGSGGTFESNSRDRKGSTRLSDGISEGPEDDLSESEGSFESERTVDEQEVTSSKQEIIDRERIRNNNNVIEKPVVKDDVLKQESSRYNEEAEGFHDTSESSSKITEHKHSGSSRSGTGIAGENMSPRSNSRITEDARRYQREEDDLLEAYKARQEEILEQERRMEEDMARKEQERLDEIRLQLQQRQEEESRKMAELERQRKEREMAIQREREEYENEMKRKQEERRQLEEERKRKEIERLEEIKRSEEESRLRSEKIQSLSTMPDETEVIIHSTDSSPVGMQAERLLTEKHRGFVEDAANTATAEIQKVQSRDRLADRSKEIKKRQLEAKADLEAVRLQTSKLNDSNKWESPSPSSDLMPLSAKVEKLNPHSPQDIHSDWSTSSEDERGRPQSRAKTPLSSGETGLGSSLSPGLSISRPSLLQTVPVMTSSTAVTENSPAVVQLKSSLRESKRQLEKYQEKLTLAETKVRQLGNHSDDLQSKLEDAINQKSAVERELFEINEENRSLKHECLRSAEDKKIAESLTGTVKDQLRRSEEKLTKEIKQRRAAEETGKKLEAERANLENALRHIALELEDLKKLLEREQEQSRLKDELYREQKKQNEAIIMESQKLSQHRSEVLTKLESADEDRKNVAASSESLREQLIHAKGEIGRLNSQLETLTKVSKSEVDLLKKQLAEQTENCRRLEDNLAKVRSDYDTQMSHMQAANIEQQNKLESEMEARHGLQSEAMVLRGRLEGTENERNEANKNRADAERQLHNLRDELYKSKTSLEKEVSSLRETNQMTTLKLNTAENKISSLEAELQTANIMLAERSSQMTMNMHDIDNKRVSITKLESDLRTEKDKNARISARLESASDKMKDLEKEATSLRRQLDLAADKVRKQEETSQETQSKLNSTLSEIKTDFEKTKGKVSEKERRLADVVEKYKEEMQQNFIKAQKQDENMRLLHQELAEASRKISSAEASLEIQLKARDDLEKERDHLRKTLRTYEEKMTVKISENQLVNGHASALKNELEHSRKVSEETSERLATTAYDLDNLVKIRTGLEDDVTKLKVDRVNLEATLQEEKAKTNLLLREIKENNEGRTQLESLLSRIKSSNIDLEEQLRTESFDKTQLAREAEEAKGLWESEVRARSKLGAKILEMETNLGESKAAIDQEKKKVRKALESRKVMQGKLDIYEKRADQHEKEVQTLKTQIKSYKRRLKDLLNSSNRIPTLQAEFDRETQQYETTITSLRSQLCDMNEKVRQESDARVTAERKGKLYENDLMLSRTHTKDLTRKVQKLEKMNKQTTDDIDNLRAHYEENFVEKAQLDRMKLDIEAKSRIELNRKLADVNAHLEEQALAREVLERSRNEQEDIKNKEMEESISKLRRDNEQYRSKLHKLQAQKETVEVEAERFKDMYEIESKRKEKLNNLLFQEREKSAESKTLFNLERSRTDKILGNTSLSRVDHSPGTLDISYRENTSDKSPGRIYSQPKEKFMESVDKELSKSIQRHLDSISTSDSPDMWTNKGINMTSSPLSTSSRQYMETLKRNYFV